MTASSPLPRSSTPPAGRASPEWLSALVDGEVGTSEVEALCAAWRADDEVQACWHRYQLIGDVLRSDELASPALRDDAFLAALRTRLAHEPVPLAPAPLASPPVAAPRARGVGALALGAVPTRWWKASGAVAAGFVAVGVAVVGLRGTDDVQSSWHRMAAAPSPSIGGGLSGPSGPGLLVRASSADRAASRFEMRPFGVPTPVVLGLSAERPVPPPDAQMLRDARLEAYFAAHRGAVQTLPSAVPGGAPRGFERMVPAP